MVFSLVSLAQFSIEQDSIINISKDTLLVTSDTIKSDSIKSISVESFLEIKKSKDTIVQEPRSNKNDTLTKRIVKVVEQNDSLSSKNDSLISTNILLLDSITSVLHNYDSLIKLNLVYRDRCVKYKDSLMQAKAVIDSMVDKAERLRKRNQLLQPLNKELNEQIKNLEEKISQQSQMLDQQIEKIKEKEQLFKEKELIYTNAIQESKIDLVKLEGQLQSKNSELAGKDREIELLAESIAERKADILAKNKEINEIKDNRKNEIIKIDTLRDHIAKTEKELLLSKTKLEYSTKEIKALKQRIHELTNKKKKIRLVQGIGIRNFRSPLYTLAPESSDNPDRYVISNENAGDYEFDFVTGATFRLLDLGKEDSKYTSDVGFFLGFGGKNLFKNFYIGPNIKIFDVIHINAGINIAEFRLLKSGFSEGDLVPQGMSIPTVSKWEITPYFGLTFDFSLITSIAGKL
ncbi:MAG: hypothetical protein C0599_03635 [Salinivirgaceae bacterium]|nr:MAG: hypothetical protein C0599_03635 [Salinivirgaceae bacterium]